MPSGSMHSAAFGENNEVVVVGLSGRSRSLCVKKRQEAGDRVALRRKRSVKKVMGIL